MVETATALAPPPPVMVTLGAAVYPDPGVIRPIATTLPDCIVAAAVAVTPLAVSYTHLTLPTNREV